MAMSASCFGAESSTDTVSRLLAEQGFSGDLRGAGEWQTIEITYWNRLRAGDAVFLLCIHRSFTQPAGGAAVHETKRLLVITDDGRYLGGYTLDEEPFRIVGTEVLFDVPPNVGDRITFTENGPPSRAWFDGQLRHLSK